MKKDFRSRLDDSVFGIIVASVFALVVALDVAVVAGAVPSHPAEPAAVSQGEHHAP